MSLEGLNFAYVAHKRLGCAKIVGPKRTYVAG